MILNTTTIKEGHSTFRELSDLDSVKSNLPPFSEKVIADITINRISDLLYIQIQFSVSFNLQCARCCSTYNQPISSNFRIILQERDGYHGQAGENDTADFYFDSNHEKVDISSAIYDEIMISLPLKPLCTENCKGIEIKESPSNSTTMEFDPRWEKLNILKKKLF